MLKYLTTPNPSHCQSRDRVNQLNFVVMTRYRLHVVALTLLLCGCSTPEVIAPRSGLVPSGADLSGNWRIQSASALEQVRIREAIRKTDGVDDDAIFRGGNPQSSQNRRNSSRSRSRGRIKGGLVDVFLELGTELKITQTRDGLFISFDRSIVEEYRFGENRMISVGAVQAQRVTGWEDKTLVIETLDRNRMKLTERFRVIENGQVLERTIILRSKVLQEESVIQLFDRLTV